MADDLVTEDLAGVEILSTGGPVHGVGSPPEGDFWATKDLEAIAEANRELADEIRAPGKIGHSKEQRLAGVSDGELPAVGWLDGASFRVSEDGTKLLADAKKVPAKVAKLIKAGAYRTRSVELSKVKSQKSEKVYDWVVTGLAWLGGKLPAVQTLDDVVALYHGDGTVEQLRIVSYAVGDVVWDPAASFESLRHALRESLNPGYDAAGGAIPLRYWVRDIAAGEDLGLVQEGYDEGDAWIVPFTRNADGTATPAPSADWTKAEMAWVETAKQFEDDLRGIFRAHADTRPTMAETKLTEEQRAAYAEGLGVKVDELSDEQVAAAEKLLETSQPPPDDGGGEGGDGGEGTAGEQRTLEQEEMQRKLEQAVSDAEKAQKSADDALEKLRLNERENAIVEVLRDGKAEPGERETLETLYDKLGAEDFKAYAEKLLKPDEQLVREFGSDEEDPTEEQHEAEEKEYASDASQRLGVREEELV